MALQLAVAALFGKDPGDDTGSAEEVFGIAGLTNTTTLGDPKNPGLRQRRVYGHIVNTRVDVSEDGKHTKFSVLYFMGRASSKRSRCLHQRYADQQLSGTCLRIQDR